MSEQCPVTITVHEYYTQNFIAKVAKKECKVSVPGYAGSWIEDVEDVRGMYFVKFQDHEGQHSFNFEPDDKLTVYWLPQPEREEAAPLLPQTVRDGDATLLGSKSIISPSEFLSGEYAYRIACDECQVTCFGQRIRTLSKRDDKGNYMIWPLNDSEVSGMAHDDDKLIVTWFPHTDDEWHEVGVKLDRPEAAAREFADGWRDAEVARLTSELEQEESDAALFLQSLAYRDQDVVQLEAEVARLREALEDALRGISTSLAIVKRVNNQLDTMSFNIRQEVSLKPEPIDRAIQNILRDSNNAKVRLVSAEHEAIAAIKPATASEPDHK